MVNTKKELTTFWRKFSKMLDAGMPPLAALDLIRQETGDQLLRAMIDDMKAAIRSGKTLSESVARWPSYFTPTIRGLIKAGETQGILGKVMAKIAEGLEDGTFEVGKKDAKEDATPDEEAAEADATEAVDALIQHALERAASDIHLDWRAGGLWVRYRIDGVLHEVDPPDAAVQKAVISRLKLMAALDAAEQRLPQDGRARLNVGGTEIDLRVACCPYVTGESVVVRILKRSEPVLGLDKLRLSDGCLETVHGWLRRSTGLVLVTGPMGSGKTTTLYSMLQELNSGDRKIVTSEDPVEFQMDGINQMPINPRLGLTYAQTIRAQLRQAPNVILVGETRDLETAQLVTQAALTGHLVLSTLHTNDAPGTVRRLLDMGVAPCLLNGALVGVLGQRLVRVICSHCKEEHEPEAWLREYAGNVDGPFYRGTGCEHCHQTGYRGRAGIHEAMEPDDATRALIAKDANLGALQKQAVKSGMVPLRDDGIAKAKEGLTTLDEVVRATS